METEMLTQILTMAGSTSPLLAVLVWHLITQHKRLEKLTEMFGTEGAKTVAALHDVDKRLAIIENYVETEGK